MECNGTLKFLVKRISDLKDSGVHCVETGSSSGMWLFVSVVSYENVVFGTGACSQWLGCSEMFCSAPYDRFFLQWCDIFYVQLAFSIICSPLCINFRC